MTLEKKYFGFINCKQAWLNISSISSNYESIAYVKNIQRHKMLTSYTLERVVEETCKCDEHTLAWKTGNKSIVPNLQYYFSGIILDFVIFLEQLISKRLSILDQRLD